MDLSIIILNYKNKNLTKECIKCIKLYNPKLDYEIIVVDNNSGDGTPEMIKENFPEARCASLPRNVGFAAGNNIGIMIARGRNILILNPDIAIRPGALEKMVAYIDAHPEIGVLAPKLVNPDNTLQYSCFKYPKFSTPLFRRTLLGRFSCGKKAINEYIMKEWNHNEIREVDWFLGACLLMPKNILNKIGMFDERYFLYFEDADLCRRFKKDGYKVVYFPEVSMVHFHRRESAEIGRAKSFFSVPTREHIKSWLKYFNKWGLSN